MFRSVGEYLAKLPNGIASYKHACVKGSVMRLTVEGAIQRGVSLEELPSEVARYGVEPPQLQAWLPEVHLNVLFLATCESAFANAGGMTAFEAWVFNGNRRFLGGPLYRILFAVMSIERVMVGVQKRWSAFRRGTILENVQANDAGATLRLVYPKDLMPSVALHAIGAAFRAAGVAAGARRITVEHHEESDMATLFEARWS